MYSTFEIRFMVAKSKVNKLGLDPLEVSIIVNKERTCLQLPRKISPSNFNAKKQSAVDADVNEYMKAVHARLIQIQTQLTAMGQPISAHKIKAIYKGEAIAKVWRLLELFDEHNKDFKRLVDKTVVIDTYERYLLTRKHLAQYLNKVKNLNDIDIKDINPNLVKSFFHYLLADMGLGHNTAVDNMKRFKKIVVMAMNDGSILHKPEWNYYD